LTSSIKRSISAREDGLGAAVGGSLCNRLGAGLRPERSLLITETFKPVRQPQLKVALPGKARNGW
jgi:hypothetical protein